MAQEGPVLVTGGLGFIGGYITRDLAGAGREVVALARSESSTPEMSYALRDHLGSLAVEVGSVEDLAGLVEIFNRVRPKVVVHSASNVEVASLYRDPYRAFQSNVGGTVNVLEAARRTGVQRVVDISSIGVLPAIQYQPIDAAHPIVLSRQGPGSGAYGAAKASGELFAFAYQRAFGLDVRIIRPSAVYGFGMRWHSANYMKQFVEPAVRGEAVRLSSGGPVPRDYTHVLDVASLTAAVLDAPDDADRIFYAATGEPLVTAADAAAIVMELVPGASIEVADVLGPDDLHELAFRGILSIENAREQLNWEPAYRSLRAGIGEYIDRYRAFITRAGRSPMSTA